MAMTVDDENMEVDDNNSLINDDDLPTSLIVINVADCIFDDDEQRLQFEEVFQAFDEDVTFQVFKNFHRIRVNYSTSSMAARARIKLHETNVCGTNVKCYFVQQSKSDTQDDLFLKPPIPDKQFLISPPASPPVGWVQPPEAQPLINYDLLTAIAGLSPGCSHELHAEASNHPSIVVHLCDDDRNKIERPTIVQTRCPSRSTSGTTNT